MLRTLETGPIDPNNWPLEILEVYSCDSNGNPKSSVQPGGNIGFKVRVRNNAVNPFDIRVMLSLVYSNKAPFKVFKVFNGSIGGEQTMAWTQYPIPIPDGAVTGNTTVYANIYNSLPKNGGFALCPEKSASFSIGTGGPAPSPPSSNGQFTVEMAISRILVWLGNYTVYSRAMYSYEIAANITQFEIVLIGDLYEDGKIDMRDIAIVARAFGTFEGDPDWNPDADLTGTEYLVPDGRVDMRDIALVAKAFGSQALIDP